MQKHKFTPRNINKSKDLLMDALEIIILRRHYGQVNASAIAKKADRDKGLIYKHFNSLENFFSEFLSKYEIIPTYKKVISGKIESFETGNPRKTAALIYRGYLRELRRSPLATRILLWENGGVNEFTKISRKLRAKELKEFERFFPQNDGKKSRASESIMNYVYWSIMWVSFMSESLAIESLDGISHDANWEMFEKIAEGVLKKLIN